MVKCIVWLLWTYATLKMIQLVFGSRCGVWDARPTFGQMLLRGEPVLFGVALALSVPTALLSSWYIHRVNTHSLERAAGCYGRLRALDRLPAIDRAFDAYKVYQVIQGAEQGAVIAGQALGLERARITRMLAQKMYFYTGRYRMLARQGAAHAQAVEAAAIARCLREPLLGF